MLGKQEGRRGKEEGRRGDGIYYMYDIIIILFYVNVNHICVYV